jgi:hypothetical protein
MTDKLGPLEDQDVLRVAMYAMDSAGSGVAQILREEFIRDQAETAHLHRAGYRTMDNLSVGIPLVRAHAHDAINEAYAARWREDVTAWQDRTPEELLAAARRSAEESDPRNGRSDPSTAKYKAYRAAQSAEPFVERDPDDDDSDEYVMGPYLGERGVWHRPPDEGDDGDEDEIDRAVRATMTHTESTTRRTVPGDRKTVLDAYAQYDREIAEQWKRNT